MAARAHRDQRRPDGTPYLGHPLQVCELLSLTGAAQETLVAALLHDAVEDSALTIGEVVARFGLPVGELVASLTEDERIDDWADRKAAQRLEVAGAGAEAVAIYAADKLSNLRQMRTLYAEHGEAVIELHKAPSLDARVAAWRADLEMVEATAPESPLLAPLRDELASFQAERAQGLARDRQALEPGQEARAGG